MVDVFSKTAGEKREYAVDFTDDLAAGHSLDVVTWSVPSGLTFESQRKQDSIGYVVISGGTAGAEYSISVSATTTHSTNPSQTVAAGFFIVVEVEPPTATDGITTVATAIRALGITNADDQKKLPRLIAAATNAIETALGYKLKQETITEAVAGSDGHLLQLSRCPVASVTSVSFDGVALDADDYSIHSADAGLLWIQGGAIDTSALMQNLSASPYAHSGEKLYSVTYTAGYVMAGSATRTLPHILEDAGLDLVRAYLNAPSNPNIKSEDVPDVYSVTYFDRTAGESGSLPASVMDKINPFRKLVI